MSGRGAAPAVHLRRCGLPARCALHVLAAFGLACADAGAGRQAGAVDAEVADAAAAAPDAALLDGAVAPDGRAGEAGALPAGGGGAAGGAPLQPIAGVDFVRYPAPRPDADGLLALEFDTPPDATGFVLTADPDMDPRVIALESLRGPDGELWFEAAAAAPRRFEPALTASLSAPLPYTFMLPSSPAAPLVPGRYLVTLRAGGGRAPLAVDVVFARERGESARALDVVLWFVPDAGLSAEQARGDARLAGALAELVDIYAVAGFELRALDYRDLPDGAALAQLDGDGELAQLLQLLRESGAPERALDLVFVERIASGPQKSVRGEVSGLPGPPAHPELARRGAVVIGLASLPGSARAAGELLAHESAHYLGLRHTSEFDGLRHDPIADTPECPSERASQTGGDGTPLLSASDCADLDGRNLLFYTPGTFAQRELSDGQRFVLARNPLFR